MPTPVRNSGTRLICPKCGHALNIVVRVPSKIKLCFLHPYATLERKQVFAPRRLGQNRLAKLKTDMKLSTQALDTLFVDHADFVSLAENVARRLLQSGKELQELAAIPREKNREGNDHEY
ncbi:MAG: hypothetical protein L3J65_01035 [Robiginitomaculum sp.]|nr:hypothetical protein [Robiginitomaculum sp.]